MAQSGGTSVVLNVHEWLSRATLDAIGEGLTFWDSFSVAL